MVFKTPTTNCNNIVIGHSLSSLLFSYLNDYPIILNKELENNQFDFCPTELPLELIGFENKPKDLRVVGGTKQFGVTKSEIENNLIFCLSLAGLTLNSVPYNNIKVGDNTVECFSSARKYSYTFNKLHIFNAENITGLKIRKENVFYEVYDNLYLRHSNKNSIDYIQTEDDFVNEIFVYPSERNGTRAEDRDVMCRSVLTREQLNSFDYSDTICRMKTTSVMKANGFDGSLAGLSKSNPTKQVRRGLLLVSAERKVYERYKIVLEEELDNVAVNTACAETILYDCQDVNSSCKRVNTSLNLGYSLEI
tara:strand:- start:429 stop:1349 length:921 start_codon:yes stop_codon:yes gene_type:complete